MKVVVSVPRTLPGRVLAIWAPAVGLWVFAMFLTGAETWRQSLAGLGIAVAVAALAAVLARSEYRRRTARPWPARGLEGWLARRPSSLSGALIWAGYMMIPVLPLLTTAYYRHRFPPFDYPAISLSGWFILSTGQAIFWNLVWRQQRRAASTARSAG